MSVYDLHEGKRKIVKEEILKLNNKTVICMLALSEDTRYSDVLHIQTVKELSNGTLQPLKGGLMIPLENLADFKAIIDEIVNFSVGSDLI